MGHIYTGGNTEEADEEITSFPDVKLIRLANEVKRKIKWTERKNWKEKTQNRLL